MLRPESKQVVDILAIYGVGAASASVSPLGRPNQVSFSLHEAECVEIRLQIQDRAASQIASQALDVECHEDSIRMGFHGRHNFAEHLGREPLRVRDVLPRPRLIPPAEVFLRQSTLEKRFQICRSAPYVSHGSFQFRRDRRCTLRFEISCVRRAKTVSVASLRDRGGFHLATSSDARVIGLRRDTSRILFASPAAPRSPLKWAAFCAAPSQPTTDANAGRGRGVVFAVMVRVRTQGSLECLR